MNSLKSALLSLAVHIAFILLAVYDTTTYLGG